MEKSPDAFRTISEVADLLETPTHVLRFWETRFPQIRPVKRAGGRRYYRPADIALLIGIKRLLHQDGMTIRGVQKILREKGIRHIAALAAGGPGLQADPLDMVQDTEPDGAAMFNAAPEMDEIPGAAEAAENAGGRIVTLDSALAGRQAVTTPDPEPDPADPFAEGDEPVPDAPFINVDEDFDSPLAAVHPAPVSRPDFGAGRSPATTAPESAPSPEPARTVPQRTGAEVSLSQVAARLRALPQGALTDQATALRPLRDRLHRLHHRLAQASRDQTL